MTTTNSTTDSDDSRYPFQAIERKWQARWEAAGVYKTGGSDDPRPKYYVLDMFPYPSGSGLHVGHCRNYVPGDVVARLKHMQGFNVLHPMGWDAFGQPAEQDAIKRGVNPSTVVPLLAKEYKRQLSILGNGYDWDREINSTDPDYYRWNQWAFLLFRERGLAYRKESPVNWCENEGTVLANEEVEDGKCWRCGFPVTKKNLPQWFFRITAYGDKLLEGLDRIEWPEGIKRQQRDWIGRSEGAEVEFALPSNADAAITVFTTRPDTLWGATFLVLAPEHPLVETITTSDQRVAVAAYREAAQRTSDMDRQAEGRDKTGVFTGAYADNPVTGEPIPIWVADYVLMGYGTGAIMAVPAHDQRDFEFARKFHLPVVLVYETEPGQGEETLTNAIPAGGTMRAFTPAPGALTAASPFAGLPNDKETVAKVVAWLEEQGVGKRRIQFKLRDWLVSRQRYWGTPIPIIYCKDCGEQPVPLDQLPVTLPDVDNYKPTGTGKSPLADIPAFVNTTCPACGGPAERETDTMAGSVDSSWYFLRFTSPKEKNAAWNREAADYWMNVDRYIGGREHAVGHLLYARFWTKVFFDASLISVDEPFQTLRNQGSLNALTPIVKGTDRYIRPDELARFTPDQIDHAWLRMSKTRGNGVTPDEIAEKYGADTLRLYVLFVAPFEDTIQWNEDALNGTSRFLNRVWDTFTQIAPAFDSDWAAKVGAATSDDERTLRRRTHQAIAKVTDDIAEFRFNTAVSALMTFSNALREFVAKNGTGSPAVSEAAEIFAKLLSPLAPHVADELWERLGHANEFLYRAPWPTGDPAVAAEKEATLVVQVNGKLRDRVTIPADADEETCRRIALASEKVQSETTNKTVRKVVVVPGKLVNVVVG